MTGRARQKKAPAKRLRPSQIAKSARANKHPLRGLALPSTAGGPYALTHTRGLTLPADVAEWMYASVRHSLGALYDASSMKWNETEKRDEISHPHQQHVVVEDKDGRVGFLSYRFDVEAGVAVMYVYEVFVEERARRRGLAVGVMRLAEAIAGGVGVRKIVLTTFVENGAAMRLYREKLG